MHKLIYKSYFLFFLFFLHKLNLVYAQVENKIYKSCIKKFYKLILSYRKKYFYFLFLLEVLDGRNLFK